eukprot:GEZU01040508.1.p1 GENE.GEZU01040508.1~~GEZU01040508.1.p1  ORF type:complete len:175 (-),score=22.64 GEZU01040508.1:14-538(-)
MYHPHNRRSNLTADPEEIGLPEYPHEEKHQTELPHLEQAHREANEAPAEHLPPPPPQRRRVLVNKHASQNRPPETDVGFFAGREVDIIWHEKDLGWWQGGGHTEHVEAFDRETGERVAKLDKFFFRKRWILFGSEWMIEKGYIVNEHGQREPILLKEKPQKHLPPQEPPGGMYM